MSGNPETLTNAAGVVVFEGTTSESGGSTTVKCVRVPITFNTPNLVLTGIPIYVPAAGDVLVNYLFNLSVSTAWDGATPTPHVGAPGFPTALDSLFPSFAALTNADGPVNVSAPSMLTILSGGMPGNSIRFTDATPLTLMVDDGAGGDPGSMVGAGEAIFVILAAS